MLVTLETLAALFLENYFVKFSSSDAQKLFHYKYTFFTHSMITIPKKLLLVSKSTRVGQEFDQSRQWSFSTIQTELEN